jgi:mono/diheme cytochrome c family protein
VVGVLGTLPPGLHVQPDWPLPFRLNLDALADPDLRAQAFLAGIVALAAVALILAGFVRRRLRWLLVICGIVAATSEIRVSSNFFVDAFPTSFRASPTTYSAESIAIGHQIFLERCATCHGATGRGDGPAAAQAQPRADLTAQHVYDHLDGDLFWWISNGIGDVMPPFHDLLDELMRWNVIDFVHANADGAQLRAAAAKIGAIGYPVPGFSAACGDKIVDPESLRGGVVHVVFDPEGSNASAARVIDRDQALAVTTVIAARQPAEGLDANVCVTDDPSLLDTMAIYREVDPQLMGRTEWLVDTAGLLRAMWYPEAGANWADDAVFGEAVLAVRRQPATPKHAAGHAHH